MRQGSGAQQALQVTNRNTDQNTNCKERSEAPADRGTLDLSAPLTQEPDYPDLDYTALHVEQLDGVVRCTVCVADDDMEKLEKLTDEEQRDLQRCERVIIETKDTFYQFALALEEIRRRKLYRDRFKTFPEYCLKVHGLGQSYAYRQAAVGKFLRENSPMGENAPQTERETRKLIAEEKAKKKPAKPKEAVVEVTDVVSQSVEVPEVPEVVVEEPASPVIPLPALPADGPTPLHELHAMAEKANSIYSDSTRRKELGNLLFKLARELGRWGALEKQQQQEAA